MSFGWSVLYWHIYREGCLGSCSCYKRLTDMLPLPPNNLRFGMESTYLDGPARWWPVQFGLARISHGMIPDPIEMDALPESPETYITPENTPLQPQKESHFSGYILKKRRMFSLKTQVQVCEQQFMLYKLGSFSPQDVTRSQPSRAALTASQFYS